MTYRLLFVPSARKEWDKLGETVREQFKKKLRERLDEPKVPTSRLFGSTDRYKIKLRASGYRLVYAVSDTDSTVTVIAVGKRDKGDVYDIAKDR